MNYKRHSMVSEERRIYAYRQQVGAAHVFYRKYLDNRFPLVFGGDFNPGTLAKRQAILFSKDGPVRPENDALKILARRAPISNEASIAMKKAADWRFIEPGSSAAIQAQSVAVPFGSNRTLSSFPDHIGYYVNYKIERLE